MKVEINDGRDVKSERLRQQETPEDRDAEWTARLAEDTAAVSLHADGIDTYSIIGIYRRHGESGGSSRRPDWHLTSIRAAAQNNPLGR